ncbi:MAG: hypothetical protein OXU36_13355, partial [Candidatus Poribacteria bacterium]|nr:hypothetical protein [Candidatus Poribacteria bacterium]
TRTHVTIEANNLLKNISIIIGIIKHAWRFLIWIAVIVALLLWLGVTNVPQLRDWFEKLLKMVEW